MKDTIKKHYPNLTGRERFQLALKAAAAGNDEEREWLVRSCPKKEYRMNEAAFVDMIETAETLTLAFALDYAQLHGMLQSVVAVENFLPHIVEGIIQQGYLGMERCYETGWLAAGGKGKPPGLDEKEYEFLDKEIEPLVLIRKDLQEQIIARLEAFSEVCQNDMELEPEIPLATFYPLALEWLDTDLTDDTVANENIKDKFLEVMREYWQKQVGELT